MLISLSKEPAENSSFLHEAERSLLRQSNADKNRLHKDGWGVAWYAGKTPSLIKSPGAVFREKTKFRAATAKARARINIVHLRWASNPGKLPEKNLIAPENTQPFIYKNITLAHNGTLYIHKEVAERLGKYRRLIRGVNDSERVFWHFIKHMEKCADFTKACENALAEFLDIWRSMDPATRPPRPYKGMNIFASDGNAVYALCHGYSDDKPSICTPGWKYRDMAWRMSDTALVVCSEPADDGFWNSLTNRQLLTARLSKNGAPSITINTVSTGEAA